MIIMNQNLKNAFVGIVLYGYASLFGVWAETPANSYFIPFKIISTDIPAKEYSILSFGASTESKDNTASIQKTIDACATAGGGTVFVPTGTFLCGPITMKSNVNLFFSQGAVLRMLPYGIGNGIEPGTYPNNGKTDFYSHLISGNKLDNIKISGNGIIDGQGNDWWSAYRAHNFKRGCLIRFDECNKIEISGITLINAPNVHITVGRKSSDVIISKVTIKCPANGPNTDGIDVWAPNVKIIDCNISCGDDNIAMDAGTQNIIIKRCEFGTGHGCSIGSYTKGIKNVLVDSCTFINTTAGIRLKSNRDRGGGEQNITYSNITMTGVKNPIYISSYYPKTPKIVAEDEAKGITETTPSWKHILIKNVIIKDSENAGIIWGLPEMPISDLIFDHVKISANKGFVINFANDVFFKNQSNIVITSGDIIRQYSSVITGLTE